MKNITPEQLSQLAVSNMPFVPLPQQSELVMGLSGFITRGGARDVFVLNGYAGTGKTSVVGAIVKAMKSLGIRLALMAPTGRAAKVAQGFSGVYASTIHRRIFRMASDTAGDTSWFLAPNNSKDTIFIVDEASLISDSRENPSRSLLFQLLRYVYSGMNCRLVLIGDDAQLPPVGQSESLAMNPARLRQLGLTPIVYSLDIPVRQQAHSGIVFNATVFRQLLLNPVEGLIPEISINDFPDVGVVSTNELDDCLSSSWSQVGCDQTLIVTRSNLRANRFNNAIRNQVMYAESPLEKGDRLVIAKNDYYWSRKNNLKGFIANGDTAEVIWVGKYEKAYGRYFVDADLQFGEEGPVVNVKIMLRSLNADGPAIPREEMERFYNRVTATVDGSVSEKIAASLDDPYYNAIQAKYAYCVTCHKAQGGQWKHVYIDMAGITADAIGPDFYRWLYTSITRATEKVWFINPCLPLM